MSCWVQKLFSSLDCSCLCCDVRELQLSISMRKFSLLSQGLSPVSYLTVHATDICSLLSVTNCVRERFPIIELNRKLNFLAFLCRTYEDSSWSYKCVLLHNTLHCRLWWRRQRRGRSRKGFSFFFRMDGVSDSLEILSSDSSITQLVNLIFLLSPCWLPHQHRHWPFPVYLWSLSRFSSYRYTTTATVREIIIVNRIELGIVGEGRGRMYVEYIVYFCQAIYEVQQSQVATSTQQQQQKTRRVYFSPLLVRFLRPAATFLK